MKAVEEIGIRKSWRFFIYSAVQIIYHQFIVHLLFLPIFRKIFLQVLGANIGTGSIIMDIRFFNWHHTGPGGLKIGKDCFIGDDTLIDLYDKVILEDQSTLAQRVIVLTHLNVGYSDHPLQKYFPKTSKSTIFKKGSVVAAASTILPGVTIGEKPFVAAGSVVAD